MATILIINDRLLTCEFLAKLLGSSPHPALEAADDTEALILKLPSSILK